MLFSYNNSNTKTMKCTGAFSRDIPQEHHPESSSLQSCSTEAARPASWQHRQPCWQRSLSDVQPALSWVQSQHTSSAALDAVCSTNTTWHDTRLHSSSFKHHLYTVSQKKRHQTLVHIFAKYWLIFKILSLLLSVGNCNKKITDTTTPKRCRYITLQNISWQKSYWPTAQQRETRCVHSEENVTAVGVLLLSQSDQLKIHCLTH